MRAVVQRVREASVVVNGQSVAAIGTGLLALLGIGKHDDITVAHWLAEKLVHLRIFEDDAGKFAHSILDVGGAVLLVSQFTLYADTRRGRRPSFSDAAPPEHAAPLCDEVAARLRACGVSVATGVFGAHMQVHLINDGPVTVCLDSTAR